MDLLSQINQTRAHVTELSGRAADAVALHPADWVRLEADLRADLPFAVNVYTPARPGARPQVAGATVYVSDLVPPGQVYTGPEAEIRAMVGIEEAATHLYAVAITAVSDALDAQTYVQIIPAADMWAALEAAQAWATAEHADRPGPWHYQYAVRPVVALGTEQAQPV